VRTVFLGTSEFASAVLWSMAGDSRHPGPHRPVLVLTRPDRRAGRGRKLASPPVAETARALEIGLAQPHSVNDADTAELIASVAPQAVVVCAFGALIKDPLLSAHEMLNVHPSLLPRWRGAAPIERALISGDEQTGVSIMRLTAGLDSGPVCLTASERIDRQDTYGSLAPRLAQAGGGLLERALDMLDAGERLDFREQDELSATYAEKIGPADRLLHPSRSAVELERVVRALHPHIGARVALPNGAMLGVRRAAVLEDSGVDGIDSSRLSEAVPGVRRAPGAFAAEGRLFLACRSGTLELLEVLPAGGRPMDSAAFLRGHGLAHE
jgi:methionyl-tRNA formyltransferase